jgi:hypothetical protein
METVRTPGAQETKVYSYLLPQVPLCFVQEVVKASRAREIKDTGHTAYLNNNYEHFHSFIYMYIGNIISLVNKH